MTRHRGLDDLLSKPFWGPKRERVLQLLRGARRVVDLGAGDGMLSRDLLARRAAGKLPALRELVFVDASTCVPDVLKRQPEVLDLAGKMLEDLPKRAFGGPVDLVLETHGPMDYSNDLAIPLRKVGSVLAHGGHYLFALSRKSGFTWHTVVGREVYMESDRPEMSLERALRRYFKKVQGLKLESVFAGAEQRGVQRTLVEVSRVEGKIKAPSWKARIYELQDEGTPYRNLPIP